MKTKFKLIFLSTVILSLGACTNLKNSFSTTPTYTATEKTNFNVQEETQFFAMGRYSVSESGVAVAQMRAKEKAKEILKKEIFNETTSTLNSFFAEVKTKNLNVSKTTIKDLSNLVANNLIKEAKVTNSWSKDNTEFVVLAIDKSKVPKEVKDIFIVHIQDVITDLNHAIDKVSTEYNEMPQTSEVVTKLPEVTPKKEEIQDPEETKITVEDNPSSDNSEPEVFLEDF
jgi:hypothetical protein